MPSKSANNYTVNKPGYLYEYAVVRYMPCIERGEFINIGLILMCKRSSWLQVRFKIDRNKILAICPDANLDALCAQIEGFEKVACGSSELSAGPIAALDVPERFRWLTAVRSASLRTSPPHPGLCSDLDDTFETLFQKLVN